jgi:hypothetical protein
MEREIRRQRKFSLAEAVAREGAGALKGASPIARSRQVLLEVGHFLENHLTDDDGSLRRTLLAHLELDAPLVARHFDRPVGALEEYLTAALEQPSRLEVLVRDADVRWGREYQEKPHFESGQDPPHPDDPYTVAGVRRSCTDLLAKLRGS